MQYDDVAERYERWVAPKYRAIAQAVAGHVPDLTDRDVMEVGAGTGLLTRILAAAGGYRSFVASDTSGPMLAIARRIVGSDVSFVEADLRAIPVASSSVDVVVACLTPMQDVIEGFTEALRLLRPGGSIVSGFWGDDYAELALLDEVRRRIDLGTYPSDRVEAATELARRAGFSDLTIDVLRLPVHHDSVDDYLAYRAAFGSLAFIAEDKREAYVDTLRQVSEEWSRPDGSLDLDWTIAVMTATKPS